MYCIMLCCPLIKMIHIQSKREYFGGNYPGGDCPGVSSWGQFSGERLSRGNCPGGNCHRAVLLVKRKIVLIRKLIYSGG